MYQSFHFVSVQALNASSIRQRNSYLGSTGDLNPIEHLRLQPKEEGAGRNAENVQVRAIIDKDSVVGLVVKAVMKVKD